MPKTLSAASVKAKLGECLRLVEAGDTVVITRYGKPVAALVDPEDLEAVQRLRAAGPDTGLAGMIGLWEDGDELADAVDDVVARRAPLRAPPEMP